MILKLQRKWRIRNIPLPSLTVCSKKRKAQGLKCVKMNATEDVGWLDSPAVLDATIERLKTVKALGLDAGLDFHGRLHKPMAKQLAKLLEPHRPLFVGGSLSFNPNFLIDPLDRRTPASRAPGKLQAAI